MFSTPQTLKLEGQEFIFNDIPNPPVITLELIQPFMKAGDHVGWSIETFGQVGFGINQSIVNLIESRKTRLVITVLGWNSKHWINFDKIRNFRKYNPCTYEKSGKTLFVFPMKLFTDKPNTGTKD